MKTLLVAAVVLISILKPSSLCKFEMRFLYLLIIRVIEPGTKLPGHPK